MAQPIQGPRGTRDFYPAEMARLRAVFDAWRRVSLRSGFAEMDGPAFEPLELYTAKSGEEIVEQLFRMTDRGGRDLALRPELTPSLARMINQRSAALPLPIKWFSIPRLWRAERPQRGRLREFFQWNIDIVGADETVSDAECIFVAVDLLRELGLGPADVVVRVSSRALLAELLVAAGVPHDRLDALYPTIDKRAKMPAEKFAALLTDALKEIGLADPAAAAARILALADCGDLAALPGEGGAGQARDRLVELFDMLGRLGVADYCQFDLGIVRGLAYYTGMVFEVYDRAGALRAVAGGGRYDNLLEVLGGPKLGAVGFGMGDVVLGELLAEKGITPPADGRIDYFLIDADRSLFGELLALAGELRRLGASAVFSYRRTAVGKQFKQAAQAGAAEAVVLGAELADGKVSVKDLATGVQRQIARATLLEEAAAGRTR